MYKQYNSVHCIASTAVKLTRLLLSPVYSFLSVKRSKEGKFNSMLNCCCVYFIGISLDARTQNYCSSTSNQSSPFPITALLFGCVIKQGTRLIVKTYAYQFDILFLLVSRVFLLHFYLNASHRQQSNALCLCKSIRILVILYSNCMECSVPRGYTLL